MRPAEKPRTVGKIHGEEDRDDAGGCGSACCTIVLVVVSIFLVIMFFPFSLLFLIKASRRLFLS